MLGDLYEIVLDKKVIQERIRRGIKVPREEMFTEIPYYSPSGVLRTMPHSKYNQARYNHFVMKQIDAKRVHE